MRYIDLHQDLFWYAQNPDYINGPLQSSWQMVKDHTLLSFNSLNDWFDNANNEFIEKNLDSLPDGFTYVNTKKDLPGEIKLDKHPIVAHIEGLESMKDEPEYWDMLERWYQKGLRSIGPVWNNSNSLGGGTKDEKPESGLTELGTKLVIWMLQKGMIVDLAHANRKTFDDISKILISADKPIFISHGNAYSVYSNYRNYTDEQLKLLADSDGVIGVFFANSFISDKQDTNLEDIFAHIDYIKKLIGIRHIAIGSDFGGILHGSPRSLDSVKDIVNLQEYLSGKGFSDTELEMFFYKNALRVISKYLD